MILVTDRKARGRCTILYEGNAFPCPLSVLGFI